MKKINHEANIKIPSEFENTVRHILNGSAKGAWLHTSLEIEVKLNNSSVDLNFIFRSLKDGTVLKRMVKAGLWDGDTIILKDAICSYQMQFHEK